VDSPSEEQLDHQRDQTLHTEQSMLRTTLMNLPINLPSRQDLFSPRDYASAIFHIFINKTSSPVANSVGQCEMNPIADRVQIHTPICHRQVIGIAWELSCFLSH
jgi:hypothetical protein